MVDLNYQTIPMPTQYLTVINYEDSMWLDPDRDNLIVHRDLWNLLTLRNFAVLCDMLEWEVNNSRS